MKQVTARLSQFDPQFSPVENAPQLLRACRQRLGKPWIQRLGAVRAYNFPHFNGFDRITVKVSNA